MINVIEKIDTDKRALAEASAKADKPPADHTDKPKVTREQIDAVRDLGELRQWAVGVEHERLTRRGACRKRTCLRKGPGSDRRL